MPGPIGASIPVLADQAAVNMQAAAGATGNGSAMTLDAKTQAVTVTVSGGVATVVPEHSFDAGATYETALVQDLTATVSGTLLSSITSAVSAARFQYKPPPGVTRLRMRISAYVSGNVTAAGIERRLA